MIIHLDFINGTVKLRNYVVVAVQLSSRGKVIYNTGLIYLQHKASVDKFFNETKELGLQPYLVDVYGGDNAPVEEEKGKGYWCPYCKTYNFWETDESGCKVCPICGISDSEFYVKKYNNLWVSKMGNKKDQKLMAGIQKRMNHTKANDKRRKKK